MAGNEIIKLLSDNKQLYFKNNNISTGLSIPTSGSYVKGDIVINTGTTQSNEPMWLCIESGSPGRWIIVGKVADIPQDLLDLVTEVGDITGLTTEDKSSIVAAINEIESDVESNKTSILNQGKDIENLKQSGVSAKSGMVQAINSKKTVPDVTTNDTWATMTQRVTDIKEGSGNAQVGDVLAGKTFTNNDGVEYTGTLPIRPPITPCTSNVLYQNNVFLRFPTGAYVQHVGENGDPEVSITPAQLNALGFGRSASGSVNLLKEGYIHAETPYSQNIPINILFTPRLIFFELYLVSGGGNDGEHSDGARSSNVWVSNLGASIIGGSASLYPARYKMTVDITSVSSVGFNINFKPASYNGYVKGGRWYAFE